jgi:hypothetical protein
VSATGSSGDVAAGASRLTLLDGLVCAYLVLPLLVFSAWFKWPVALALALLTGYGFVRAMAGTRWRHVELSRASLAIVVVIALAWTALAGIGHFFYANTDWITRDAVLRDLVETPWPPMYASDDGAALILRAPIGYYLPVAAAGSWLGLRCADILLYLWTAGGFALVLCTATTLFQTRRQRVLACLLMLGFGGLDLLGVIATTGALPAPGEHIEWWASFVQYSSNSTLLFWVPNHALPAWLGLLMAMRHWRTPELARISLMLAAAVTLWSPLSALGLVPFYVLGLNWRRDIGALLATRSGLPFLALAGLAGRYLTMDTQSIPRGWAIDMFAQARVFWIHYAGFCLVEFGVLALLLARLRAFDPKVALAAAILLILPFYHFGNGNDLVMRCSIPALAVLALAAVRPLAQSDRPVARALLAAVLVVGALGAAQEPERALMTPRWALTGKTLVQISADQSPVHVAQLPPNYVGHLNQPGLQALMRPPSMVLPSPDVSMKLHP